MKESSLAYAKINISLDIISKMDNGYHNLKTIMQTVCLFDEVTIECSPGEGVKVKTGLPYIPNDARNIAGKAAVAFFDASNIKGYKTEISINKKIPVCAGLGGGSTDGACVIRLLDKMFNTEHDSSSLERIASSVGSDVPFSLYGGTKLVEGRGEKISKIPPLPHCYFVICKPPFSCSTPELFGLVKCEKIRARPDTEGIIKSLEKNDINGVARRMYNVFEDILPRGRQEIAEIKSTLLDNGAQGSVMTGSGPSVLGLFTDKTKAESAFEQLKDTYKDCFLTETIDS
ncbi:MAG: 4-(cytidine 5'-diphospho)-2-C-methyl-D-erythritol kinase [Oscillospiraceae bacterium]|nr:4-(cytidine 5'-diphospho)-2-C-methyl-D-erythritol kinase [Oscillospiraceae bacterium]